MSDDLPLFYWRPGCGFCAALRWQLQGRGIPLKEINIWEDSDAAARVRSIAGGNETVPTLVVGDKGMVNPTADTVEAKVRRWRPELIDPVRPTPIVASAVLAALAAAALWIFLAIGSPTITYHLAPVVVVAAGPLLGRLRGGPLRRTAAIGTTAAGVFVAVTATGLLAAAGALAGPTLTGGGSASAECLLMIVAAALITPLVVSWPLRLSGPG